LPHYVLATTEEQQGNWKMVKTSAWGTRRFQKGNAEDEAAKRSIYHKLLDLGEDPNDKNSQLKPEEIHKMDKSWQPYSADSFGKVVRALRKIISKSDSCCSFI
jgi:hypothetical protein